MARNNISSYIERPDDYRIPNIIDYVEEERERIRNAAPENYREYIDRGAAIQRERDEREREEKRKQQRIKEERERKAREEKVERERREAKRKAEEEEVEEQKRRQKKIDEYNQQKVKEEEDKAYKDWLKDKTDWMGPLSGITQWAFSADGNMVRKLWDISNTLGSLVDKQLSTYADSKGGQISLNDIRINGAHAHKRVVGIENQIAALEAEQKQFAKESGLLDQNWVANNKDTQEYQQKLNKYNSYLTQIQDLYQQLVDPYDEKLPNISLKDMDEYYKADFVQHNQNALKTAGNWIWDQLRSVGVTAYAPDLRNEIAKQRIKEQAFRYNDELERTKYTGYGGVKTSDAAYGDTKYDISRTDDNINQWKAENIDAAESVETAQLAQEKLGNFFNVADAYKRGEEVYQNASLFDSGYWHYVFPGTVGSSFSSVNQAIATGMQVAGVGATLATGNPMFMNAATLGSSYNKLEAGKDENRAESFERRIENLFSSLQQMDEKKQGKILQQLLDATKQRALQTGHKEDWINEHFNVDTEEGIKNLLKQGIIYSEIDSRFNVTDPEYKKALIHSTAGVRALYEADNMRTISMLPFELAFEVYGGPLDKAINKSLGFIFKPFEKGSSRLIKEGAEVVGERASRTAAEDAATGVYKNGFRKKSKSTVDAFRSGFDKGSAVGASFGFGSAGSVAAGTAAGAVNAAVHLAKEVLPKETKAMIDGFEQVVANKYMKVYDKLLKNHEWLPLAAKYGYNVSKQVLGRSMEEGAEEAVQYINSKKDFASKYGFGGINFVDLIINDLVQGKEVLKAYGSLFGLTDSKYKDDIEFWQNVKGGFALGGGMTAVINIVGSTKDYAKQLDGDKFVVQNFAMMREADKMNRTASVQYAKAAMNGNVEGVRNAINTRMQHDKMRETPEYTQEEYDEQLKQLDHISRRTNDPSTRAKLEAKGIKYGSEEYANAIADLSMLDEQKSENRKAAQKNNGELSQIYYSKQFNDEATELAEEVMDVNGSYVQDAVKKAGETAATDYLRAEKEAGRDTSTEEFKNNVAKIRKETEDAERERLQATSVETIRNITRAVNKLHALIKLKSKISTINDWYKLASEKFGLKVLRPDAKLMVKSIERQIKEQKAYLKEAYDAFNEKASDADIIKQINTIRHAVRIDQDNAEQLELANALINANSEVVQNYIDQFEEGIVINKEGKYEYNPAQKKIIDDRSKRYMNAILSGKQEEAEVIRNEQEYAEYDESKVADNPYAKRIKDIIETNKQNEALDWMVQDIAEGDAVSKAYEVYQEQKEKEKAAKQKNSNKPSSDPYANQIAPQASKSTVSTNKKAQVKSKLDANKKKYETKIQKMKESYGRRKARINKSRRGNLNSSIPFMHLFMDIGNKLFGYFLPLGYYGIAKFVEDVQAVMSDTDVSEILLDLKRAYIDKLIQLELKQSDLAKNMDPPEVVAGFTIKPDVNDKKGYTDPNPVVTPVIKQLKDKFVEMRVNSIPQISGYFDTIVRNGNKVDVYVNKAAVEILSREDKQEISEILKTLNNLSDDQLINYISQYISKEAVNEYSKYLSNPDIKSAIARAIFNNTLDEERKAGIQIGKIIRDNVINIFLGNYDDLNPIELASGQWDEFVKAVEAVRDEAFGKGYTVLDTMQPIYTTDKDGNKISSEMDILLVNEQGDVQIIDVTYGYHSVIARQPQPRTLRKLLDTIYQNENSILTNAEDIISNVPGVNVNIKGSYVYCFVYDEQHNDFYQDGFITIHGEKLSQDEIQNNVQRAKVIVDSINQSIDDYNTLAEKLKMPLKDHLDVYSYTRQNEFDDYFNHLSNVQENLKSDIQRLNEVSQSVHEEQEFEVQEIPEEDSPDEYIINFPISYLHEDLVQKVRALDDARNSFPIGKIVTAEDRQNIIQIYKALFDSQIALNEFLQHPDASEQDVTSECEVIASTLEQIHVNKAFLGTDAIFVQKWWLTQFFNPDSSKDFSQHLYQVNAWVNTLKGYVDTDDNLFDQHPALVEWYSSVINTYFKKLVDETDKIMPDSNRAMFGPVIQRARDLISNFNLNWGTQPDKTYDTPAQNELEYISRMPLRWNDLYGVSESHSPAIDQMANKHRPYYYFSQKPDFLQKADISFGLNKDGEVQVCVKYEDKFAYFTFTNNNAAYGSNLTPDIARRNKVLNRGNKKFINKLKAMIEYRMKHPEYDIVVDKFVNKGSINYSKNQNAENNVMNVIFSDPNNKIDPYNVTISEKDFLGVLSIMLDRNNNPIDYKIKTGPNLKSDAAEKFDSEFKKQKIHSSSGMLVYFFDYGDGRRIGVPMTGKLIGNDASRLVYLIQKLSNGIVQEDGYNIFDLLSQRLFIQTTQPNYSSAFNVRTNLIELVEPNKIKIGGKEYNLNTQKQEVINIVSKMHNVIPGFLLSDRISNTTPAVVDKFRQDPNIQQVTLPNGIAITKDDIVHNSTWLGHFFRNGVIVTRAEINNDPKYSQNQSIKGYRQINFSNPRLVKKSDIEGQPSAIQSQQKTDQQRDRVHNLLNSLKMTINKEDVVYRSEKEQKEFIEEIRDFFKYVFGTSDDVEFVLQKTLEDTLGIISEDEAIAGECTSQLIRISTYAPKSVMYHEAFHKIIELILPNDQRNALYDAYRKHNGEHLSERAVAEALADMFVDYMENKNALRNAKWYNVPRNFFKKVGLLASLVSNLGVRQAIALFSIYRDTNKGRISNRKIEEEINSKKQRFEEKFGDHLYKTIKSRGEVTYEADFRFLTNSSDVHEMCKSLGYLIGEKLGFNDIFSADTKKVIDERSLSLIDDKTRRQLCNLDENDNPLPIEEGSEHRVRAWREVFETKTELRYDKNNKPYYYKWYPKFAALHTLVGDYLSSIAGDYKGKYQVSEEEYDEDEVVQRKNIEKYDKASIEFNKLDGTTSKVKMFFGTIPYSNADEASNMFGTNTYMPLEEVYNIIVNDHHKVRTIDELMNAIERDASYNPMYATVYKKLKTLYDKMYTEGKNGETIIDYDAESLMIQILMTIRSQKHDFKIAETTTDKAGVKSTTIKRSSSDRDTRVISRQWQQILVSGQVGVFQHGATTDGKLAFREGTDKNIFNNLADFFDAIIADLAKNADQYPADSAVEIRKEIVRRLNQIGILVSDKALEHMLMTKYHGVGADSIYKWLSASTTETSITPFLKTIRQFAPGGVINDYFIKETGFAKVSFVTNLANAEGLYRRITTQQMALGLNGKKLYSISQNSTISKICDDLSVGDRNSQFIKTLLNFQYNLYNDGLSKRGSLIAKYIANGTPIDLRLFTFIGSKSDNKGDSGSSYTEQATVDDYMAKLAMLQSGSIIMPTLADKSMYQAMDTFSTDGEKIDLIPGMKFVETKDDRGPILSAEGAPTIAFMGKYAYLRPNDEVLRQMIEYAVTEKVAIERCMEDLKTLKPEEKIKNYHTDNKDGVEPNGTRFLVFTEVVVMEDGKIKTINLNDPNESSQSMLDKANKYFFSRPIDEQMTIMAQTLAMQTVYEIQKAEELGLVTRKDTSIHNLVTDKGGKIVQKQVIHDGVNNRQSLMNIESDQLNTKQIGAVVAQLMKTMPESWKALNKPETYNLYQERIAAIRSMAIAAILQDATLRSIISSQEVLRCFCGHPGMFKVTYDKAAGHIKDSTFDLQKRIGGMISTGDDNVLNLPNMTRTYTCAEIKDYEIGVPERTLAKMQDRFETGMLSDLYFRYSREGNVDENRSSSNNIDIAMRVKNHELIPFDFQTEDGKQKWFKFVDNAVERAKQYADAYKAEINVADGAAYITADMCRDMLRMNGRLDGKAIRALEILTDESTQYSWMQSAEAYKDIYDAINITPTKYTAYGFREHTVNKSKCSDVAVPYYNKFALFPIFPCMATGNMHALYEKMKAEGVDMVLMDSAVKIGSQGSVKYNGTSIDQPFNTYTQDFSFIRKQQNTDPEEGSTSAVCSQVLKVGLQNLILDKVYQDFQTGNDIVGQQIYDNIMKSIKDLAKIGVQTVTDKFMKDGVCDQKKLSEYLNDKLNAKNASNTTIEGIQTHKENGVDVLNMPLAATADASWIESIIIALIKKEVIDINAPGSSFIQRSVFAIEGEGNSHLSVNDGKKLQMINENGSMDCILSIDYFTDVLFANNMLGKTFEEQRNWLIKHKIIGNTKDVKANTIGYRVPTQAQSSIHSLRCVDILPACKNTIILPEEFTKITGADFDIDHVYLWSYNYIVDGDNVSIADRTNSEDNEKKYLQNELLSNMLTLINSVENSMHFLYKTVDTDTSLLRKVSDKLSNNKSLKHHSFNFGTLHEQIDRKNDYITGKIGIGPYALNVTNQELTRLNQVVFASTIVTKSTRISRLDNIVDKDDNPISSWESGYINGHVDIVKDSFITVLDVNQFTYNLSNLLTRCGFSDVTLWFLCQPVIREMAKASNNSNGQYTRDGKRGTYSIREEAIAKACVDVTKLPYADIANALLRIKKPTNKEDYKYIARCINYIENNAELLEEVAIRTNENPDIEKFIYTRNDGIQEEVNVPYVQLQVLKAYTALEKYQRALGKLVQYTKIDTKKYGNSLIQTRKYLEQYDKLVHPNDRAHSIFDMNSIDRLINNTWIEYKTRNAINLPFNILGGQVFNANEDFINEVLACSDILNTKEDLSESFVDIDEVAKSMVTAIKSSYIIEYARSFSDGYSIKPKSDADIAKLFTSSNSLSKRLNRLLDQVRNNPTYKRLASNYLLQSITAEFEEEPIVVEGKFVSRPSFISISSSVGDNKNNADMFSEAWEDLLNDDDPFVRNFANDLIIYAFLTSGEYNGWTHMFKYVPYNWRVGKTRGFNATVESYADFCRRMLSGGLAQIANRDIYDQIVANNFMNRNIIRSSRIVEQDGTVNFATNKFGNIAIGKWEEDIGNAPKYITLKKPGTSGKNQNDYNVYKCVGFYENYPVYAQIVKRGYHHKGYDIYEYGWDFNYIENKSVDSAILYRDEIRDAINRLEHEDGPIQTDLNMLIKTIASKVNEVISNNEKGIWEDTSSKRDSESNNNIIETAKTNYTRQSVQNNPNTLYIFTDNTDRTSGGQQYGEGWYKEKYGDGGFGSYNNPTTAQIRGLDNAAPISTMRYFYRAHQGMSVEQARWKDSDIEEFKKVVDSEIEDIKKLWDSGKFTKIVSPAGDGFFNSRRAKITKQSEIGKYLQYKLKELEDYVNSKNIHNTTNRPYYDFGKVHLTDNDKQHVSEKISFVDVLGNKISIDGEQIDQFIKQIRKILTPHKEKQYVKIPYYQWKRLIQIKDKLDERDDSINQFEYFVYNSVDYVFVEENWVDTQQHNQYDKHTKEIKLDKDFYDFVKLLHDNINSLKILLDIFDDNDEFVRFLFNEDVQDTYTMFEKLKEFEYEDIIPQYSYSDDRQLELFSNEDFELSEEEKEEAKKYKEACEGGKI